VENVKNVEMSENDKLETQITDVLEGERP